MARPPRITSRETVQNVGVVDTSSGVGNFASQIGVIADRLGAQARREAGAERELLMGRISTDARVRAAEFAQAAEGDPERFQALYDGWAKETARFVDEGMRGTVEADLTRIGAGQYVGLVNQATARQRTLKDDQLKAAADGFKNDLLTGAAAGRFDETEAQATQRYIETVNARVEAGFISRERGDRLVESLGDEARGEIQLFGVRETYEADGYLAAMRQLQEDVASDENIPPELRRQIVNTGEAWLADRNRLDELEGARTEEALDERRESIMGKALTMYEEGALTQDWIQDQAGVLTFAQRRTLGNMVRGDADHVNDPAVVGDLTAQMYAGEDIEADALRAHREGRLTNEQLGSFVSKNRTLRRTDGPRTPYERERKRIVESLDPGPLVNDPAARVRSAEAEAMYDRWRAGFPDDEPPTDAQVQQKADEIIDRFSLINFNEMTLVLPKPLYFVGSRQKPNIAASKVALRKALEAGDISEQQAQREAVLIRRWEDAIRMRGSQ
jgi:hypothetical protein